MASSTDPAELLDVWKGWHTISPPMRKDFTRFVELSNKGAVELGFKDTGAMWRSKYDMPADDFSKELDRLWDQVRPLYLSLHAYVRTRLHQKYGSLVPENGPIPADLLGNIWAQDWSNIYKLVAPKDADPGYDLTQILKARKTEPLQMVKYGEGFFKSLGFDPLPDTFWQRSLFVKPRDREVVCHASAWDVDNVNDLRIKMCIDITEEDFTTIHHELGHNFYQRAYNTQPIPVPRCAPTTAFTTSHWRYDRALGHARVSGEARLAPESPRRLQGHRPAAQEVARKNRVPAIRADDRPVALAGFFR